MAVAYLSVLFYLMHECAAFIVESVVFVLQAEDGIRELVRSRGLGDVYKRQFLSSLSSSAGPLFLMTTGGHVLPSASSLRTIVPGTFTKFSRTISLMAWRSGDSAMAIQNLSLIHI